MNDLEYEYRNFKNVIGDLYHNILFSEEGNKGLYYIKSRGINEDTLRKFSVGYAPHCSVIVKYLLENNLDPTIAYASNFIKNSKLTGERKDYFNNHIVFPIFKDGNIVSFTGRRAENIDKDPLRHLHLKGCGKYIFNGSIIKDSPYVFIVESPINCLTLDQWGYNAISVMGASSIVSLEPKDFIGKYIYILYDSDTNGAGQNAAFRTAIHFYENERLDTFILTLPEGYDINDYAQKYDVSDFRKNIMSKKVKFTSTQRFRDWLNMKRAELLRPKIKYDKQTDKLEKVSTIPITEIVKLFHKDIQMYGSIGKCKCFLEGHTDEEASFTIYAQTNTVKCFGCGFFGDGIQLVRRMEGLSYNNTLNFLIKTFYGE